MDYSDFADPTDYETAPTEGGAERFRHFASSANAKLRERLGRLIEGSDEHWPQINAARIGFHNYIMALGNVHGYTPFDDPANVPPFHYQDEDWHRFKSLFDYQLALLTHRKAKSEAAGGFALTAAVKKGFRTHIAGLRKYIDESGLPEKKKKELLAKVAEFEAALEGRRMNMAVVWLFAGCMLGHAADFVQVADSDMLKSLVTGVVKTANEAKEASDELLSLTAPDTPLALAGPPPAGARRAPRIQSPVPAQVPAIGFSADLDDEEIPF